MADEEKDAGAEPVAEAGGKNKKKLFLIIGIAVAVLAGGGGAAFFVMGGEEEVPVTAEGAEGAAAAGAEGAEGAAAAGAEGAEGAAAEGAEGAEGGEASADKKEDKDEEAADSSGFGESYTFKPFHLNLGNPLENHYIKLDVAIEYRGGEKQKEEIDKRRPQLRDAVGDVVSSKSREFLLGPDGKAQLRREILIRLNRYMTTPLESVYITDMLVE